MKRTIERLNHKRKEKEKEYTSLLNSVKDELHLYRKTEIGRKSARTITELENALNNLSAAKGIALPGFSKKTEQERVFFEKAATLLKQFREELEENVHHTQRLIGELIDLNRHLIELVDAKDREWDALGSNHVGTIFKSMEWRVDKLTAEYNDASLLMKKFRLLREKLDWLLAALDKDKKKRLTRKKVAEIVEPLRDFGYAGFENRYRGTEEEIAQLQKQYLQYFLPGPKVLDLGCGRGEFLALLNKHGIEAEGIDINDQMIEICRDKGLACRKGDIIEILANCGDESLGGIFASQVVEHMDPDYLTRMVGLAYRKLAPSRFVVLETINPTSVFSLVQIYYLDISHRQPIHPEALKFLLESTGFSNVELVFSSPPEKEQLQPLPTTDDRSEILNQNIDKLNRLLYSPSNFAAVGQKH